MNKSNSTLIQVLLDKLDHLDETALAKKKVFNIANLAAYTGWSFSKIYKLTSSKIIPHSKPTNGSLFFDREKIEEWLLENPCHTLNESQNDLDEYLRRKH